MSNRSSIKRHEKVKSYMTLAMKLKDERWAGRDEGRAEGELNNQIRVIRNMLARNESLELIWDTLGFSVDEVRKLIEKSKIYNASTCRNEGQYIKYVEKPAKEALERKRAEQGEDFPRTDAFDTAFI